MSGFDRVYRKVLLSKCFVKGWGNPYLIQKIIENHKNISRRETCKNLYKLPDVNITKQTIGKSMTIIEGSFLSPFQTLIPESMDIDNREAKFQLIIPKKWQSKFKPLCIHYPGTGDHGFFRRKLFLANRLIKDGIASLIHTNPYYGSRKPSDQKGSSLNYLSDLFVMGGALILEAQVLLQWATKEGFGPLAIHGISMGGHMACLGASVYPEPVCLIPCLSWTTASQAFTAGAISSSVSWDILSDQYHNDSIFSQSIRAAIEPPVPYHLQHSNKQTLSSDNIVPYVANPSNVVDSDGLKPNKPSDIGKRNFHFLTASRGNTIIGRAFSSDDINKVVHKSGSDSSLKSALIYLQRLHPSLLKKFGSNGNVTKDEMADVAHELRHSSKLTMLFSPKINVDNETMEFMRDILDYFTHLGNYSVPVDPRLVTAVVAENDAYIPMTGVAHFRDIWGPSCEVEVLKGLGHILAYLDNTLWWDDKFREAIVRTMNRYVELYHNEPGPFGKKKI